MSMGTAILPTFSGTVKAATSNDTSPRACCTLNNMLLPGETYTLLMVHHGSAEEVIRERITHK